MFYLLVFCARGRELVQIDRETQTETVALQIVIYSFHDTKARREGRKL